MSVQQESAPVARRVTRHPLKTLTTDYGLILVLIAVLLVFSILRPSTYFTVNNLQMIASTNAVLAMLALAAVPPLVTGQFDLSIGFQLALAQSLAATLIIDLGVSPALAAIIVIGLGLLIGLANGLLVAYGGLNAFITTLATGILLQGAAQLVTNGESIFGHMPAWWLSVGRSSVWALPLPIVYVVAACALLWLALEYTSWGRRCFAVGGNARAALLVGIPVKAITVQSFVLAGALCSVAGLLSTSILGSANPNVGASYMLPAFAAVFLGATSIRPGRFNAWGTVIAVYALAAGIDGLQQFGAPFYIEQFFNGGALLLAISLAKLAGWRRAKKPAEPR